MTLPFLISLPHAGVQIPPEIAAQCCLTQDEIVQDGDEGASVIYDIQGEVETFVTTPIARAIIDLNRKTDDRRADGVVKTHTCWNVPVYTKFPDENTIQDILRKYYHPYHQRLSAVAAAGSVKMGIDCHTMLAEAPPIDDTPGKPRPNICLSDLEGQSMPTGWMQLLAQSFEKSFNEAPAINDPFKGGYITQAHASEMPWVQIEFSRGDFLSNQEKRVLFLKALHLFNVAL